MKTKLGLEVFILSHTYDLKVKTIHLLTVSRFKYTHRSIIFQMI
jgi:hypothetical protein